MISQFYKFKQFESTKVVSLLFSPTVLVGTKNVFYQLYYFSLNNRDQQINLGFIMDTISETFQVKLHRTVVSKP